MVKLTGLAGAILVAGCGGGGAEIDASPVDAGRSTVTGSYAAHYHGSSNESSLPADLSGAVVAAWVPLGDGEFERIDGQGFATGRFEIADVPEQRVYIQLGPYFVATDARDVDFGYDLDGRADTAYAPSGTTLRADVANLAPWTNADDLLLSAPSRGFEFPLEYLSTPAIPVGATDLVDLACDWQGMPMLDTSDAVTVYQYEAISAGSTDFVRPTRMAELAPLAMIAGDVTDVSATMTPLTIDHTYHLEWNAAAYAGLADEVYPLGFALWSETSLGLARGGTDPRWLFTFSAPQLAWAFYVYPLISLNSTIAYADPFPAEWTRVVYASTTFGVDAQVDGADPTTLFADVIYAVDLDSYGNGPVTVKVGPAGPIWIGELPADGPRSGVGLTPQLTWHPPGIGAATGYDVRVYRLFVNGSRTDYEYETLFFTAEREITMPPGVLAKGQTYAFQVTAVWAPEGDVTTRPMRASLPYAMAQAWTGPMEP